MATVPKQKTITNASKDVLNAIRNSASLNYRNYVPIATDNADSIRAIGAVIMDYPALQNEFVSTLINRIGKVVVTSKSYSNPWKMFKKGVLDFGETIEEVFVELAKPFQFDAEVAEQELFKRVLPDTKATFYEINYQKFYKVTISEMELRKAFLSYDGVTNMIERIVETLYTAMEYDEFQTMKYMLAKRLNDGHVYTQSIDDTSVDNATVTMRKSSNDLTFMSDKYNLAHVHTHTLRDDQYIIINTDFDAQQSVKNLARAFHMSEAELLGHVVLVDGFGNLDTARLTELLGDQFNATVFNTTLLTALNEVPAILCDRDFFMIYDTYIEFRDVQNVQGLYWNNFLHVGKVFAISPFANAIAFIPDDMNAGVTSVSVTPTTATVAVPDGGLAEDVVIYVQPNVSTSGFVSKEVTYKLGGSSSTLISKVKLDSKRGTLTVPKGLVLASSEKGATLTITVTSAYSSTKSAAMRVTFVAQAT